MPGTRWIALGLFVAALPAQVLPAQEPPARPSPKTAEELTRALASESPTEVAAAAAAARTSADRQLVGRLRKTLRAWSEDRHPESNRVRMHLLDALIAQHARLPAAELLPLLEDPLTSMPAFILLCREPQQNQTELLGLFSELKPATGVQGQLYLQYLAVGSLLCQLKAPGFAAFLWQQTAFDLHVIVRGGVFFGDPVSFEIPVMELEEAVAGFPPEPLYRLQWAIVASTGAVPGEAAELLAPGSSAIAFTRTEKGRGPDRVTWNVVADPTFASLGWLETMAGCPLTPREDPRVLVVEFTTPEAFVAEVLAARQRVAKGRDDLRAALLAAGALTTEQAAVADPVVQVIVEDKRNDKRTPLPPIPFAK